jgi:UPF0755 protein
VRLFIAIAFGIALGIGGVSYGWLHQRFDLTTSSVDLSIEPGSSAREVALAVVEAGVSVNPVMLHAWFRLSGQSRQIKAGSYELDHQTTPLSLLRKLVRGEEALRSVTLVEGWTFRQVREALKKADQLKPDSQGMSATAVMEKLGRPDVPAEGRFFPDTYTYSKGSSDFAVLERAMRLMDKRLAAAWAQRDEGSPLQTPDQALILASIIEKETGAPVDRPLVAAVFNNRLKMGMPLQTDPTVIYGLGESFDGNLRKKDLQTDTPWNTYTRAGLPATAIAMPGKAALLAAVKPGKSNMIYFVARGDGSSQFSTTLDEHNRAVNKYQRNQ